MKNHFSARAIWLTLVSLSTLNPQLSTVFAQGSLTPPGAPAPTMKTLDQIEARTPITNTDSLVTISQPGSYYLTHNLTVSAGDGIDITTNGVTLDLNGFTIASTQPTAATDSAIRLSGSRTDIAIYNGHISSGVGITGGVFGGGGFGYGIYDSSMPHNVRIKDVSVAGVLYHGIYLNLDCSTVVESCTVNVAGSYGIYADSVSDSTAFNCGSVGIYAGTAHNCKGYGIGSSYGLYANDANNCYGSSSGNLDGLHATTANNCSGSSSGNLNGLYADNANNCFGFNSGNGAGLNAFTANNCSGSCSGNLNGLYADNANNCFGFNSGNGPGLNAFTANNCFGQSASGPGLYVDAVATGCYGYSSSGTGLYAYSQAIGCYGYSSTGTGLVAYIANCCWGTSVSSTYKYNMPP
jgi:hypothetical protein